MIKHKPLADLRECKGVVNSVIVFVNLKKINSHLLNKCINLFDKLKIHIQHMSKIKSL